MERVTGIEPALSSLGGASILAGMPDLGAPSGHRGRLRGLDYSANGPFHGPLSLSPEIA